MNGHSKKLHYIYDRMNDSFGSQGWWPGSSPFEVMVGAILTQNTNWKNVELAIANLKGADCFDAHKLYELPPKRLATLIRPSRYFNVKAKRLRNFLKYFLETYDGDVGRMQNRPMAELREELLKVNGIGPETADAMLLYALGKPTFVVDAYTKRILHRHHLCEPDEDYHDLQSRFMKHLPHEPSLFNQYHALIVELGKNFCLPGKPRCEKCPLNGWNWPNAKEELKNLGGKIRLQIDLQESRRRKIRDQ